MSIPRSAPLPGQPHDADGPVFREAWEAQTFAMALVLHERGLFTWNEWSAALAEEIKSAQADGDLDLGMTYYSHWLKTLERLVVEKDVATEKTLVNTAAAWQDAARATPHGKPIILGKTSLDD